MIKRYIAIFFSVLIGLLFVISCKNDEKVKNLVQHMIRRKIVLPSDSLIRNFNQNNVNPLNKKFKILTNINGDCSVCIDELKEWESFMAELNINDVGFVFLINSTDRLRTFVLLDSLEIKFKYPYFQDDYKKLFKVNNFPEDKLYQTVLLDEENRVILIGSPIAHEKIQALYISEINKRLK